MSTFEIMLLVGVALVAWLRRDDPRAWVWLGAGTASYVATSAYYWAGMPYHPAFTFAADGAVCLALIVWARRVWEVELCAVFLLSAMCSLLRHAALIDDGLYRELLEAANWLALIAIGGPGALELARAIMERLGGPGPASRGARRARALLLASARVRPTWRAAPASQEVAD